MASWSPASYRVGAEDAQTSQRNRKRAGRTAVKQQVSPALPVSTQEIPYSIQVSQTRIKPKCPYHTPIVDLHSQRTSTSELSPMERFLSVSNSEPPVALSDGLRIGTAASGGCTCGRTPEKQCTAML
ncbi:hypothetical protein PMIN03_010772 [Paraphaeosphaeria minitans]|uniref:Uncharacterized protein n=1 Tax=Paraphaeosphaeria minitans TaxID=565426 RepID=A0A9P6GKL1_9PLEO|nr:hypothetical protein PMIN01_04685 [Paraphaeosphaeria minitans]